MNLLNGLAVSDTGKIWEESEIHNLVIQVETIAGFEATAVLKTTKLGDTNTNTGFVRICRSIWMSFIKTILVSNYSLVFYSLIPDGELDIYPNHTIPNLFEKSWLYPFYFRFKHLRFRFPFPHSEKLRIIGSRIDRQIIDSAINICNDYVDVEKKSLSDVFGKQDELEKRFDNKFTNLEEKFLKLEEKMEKINLTLENLCQKM